tara:strand:- start:296 stop:445 length:150 start_codon:yes stop_codon:yes gene_type:complete
MAIFRKVNDLFLVKRKYMLKINGNRPMYQIRLFGPDWPRWVLKKTLGKT